MSDVRARIRSARGIVILTGAGVSAESGVPTFRGEDGLWRKHRVETLATPEAFRKDPRLVWEWYETRRAALRRCAPNPAHVALARFLLKREDATLVTQNVDGLHARAIREAGGALPFSRLLPLHGSLFRTRCERCAWERIDAGPVDHSSEEALPRCPDCGARARPGVVWFGEMLPAETLDAAFDRAGEAELALVVGTSALVHPAASIPLATLSRGGYLIEVNPSPTPITPRAQHVLRGAAGRVLPQILC